MPMMRALSSLACWNLTSSTRARISQGRRTRPRVCLVVGDGQEGGGARGIDGQDRRQRIGLVQGVGILDQHGSHAAGGQGDGHEQGVDDAGDQQRAQDSLDRL